MVEGEVVKAHSSMPSMTDYDSKGLLIIPLVSHAI